MQALVLDSIDVFYGKTQALRHISFHVPERGVVALLGSNGAGKSTTLRSISGLVRPKTGKIRFWGQDIQDLEPEKIFKLGISHVPQGRELFPQMSVKEHLVLGALTVVKKKSIEDRINEAFSYFPVLRERRNQKAFTLSGGEQQMLTISRALMSKPKLLLFDELSAGLAPLVIKEIERIIRLLNQNGTTILVVEQNIRLALNLSNYAYVLRSGEIVFSDQTKNISSDDEIFQMYLR
jgi:branched-chain amino acid transport system ATP-binding protein